MNTYDQRASSLRDRHRWLDLKPGEVAPSRSVAARSVHDPAPADLVRLDCRADEATVAAAVARAPTALLVSGTGDMDDFGRFLVRLSVAEALLDRPDGGTAVALLLDRPAAVLAAPLLAAQSPRLVALGLDRPALAAALGGDGSAGVATARGLLALAAAARDLVPFERTAAGEPETDGDRNGPAARLSPLASAVA
ncbi:hypothetical protein [Chthonobacter rhizosphaerae]|uniref:hypothetical protein n=1 Tax=Chthonobacter rhizosphaerae TaxID=2735553 RepID=UPI0015EE6D85|nr:hypothetical protein [Chthonobacter rhizosphaerae]